MLKGLFVGLFCFVLFLILHVVIFHFKKTEIKKRFRMIRNIFFALIPLYIILYAYIPRESLLLIPADPNSTSQFIINLSKVLNFTIGFMLYVFLFMCYGQFYFILDRSLSVRMMVELSKQNKVTYDELKKVYSPDEVYARRFKHLVESGCSIETNGYYTNTPKGNALSWIFTISKKILQVWPGG
ncbi:MAG: hypothetical protein A2252_03015 [Elusimicrobia bacterium RIFOXYA2_FULL_39_19]|nr:MAG: hypothetical protein A2252_03015 [Elusimicrobia bacterium RIFOXYA2_FULL_39_19]